MGSNIRTMATQIVEIGLFRAAVTATPCRSAPARHWHHISSFYANNAAHLELQIKQLIAAQNS